MHVEGSGEAVDASESNIDLMKSMGEVPVLVITDKLVRGAAD